MPDHSSDAVDAAIKCGVDLFDSFLKDEIFSIIRKRSVSAVADPMIYSLQSGGKRIRPLLLMLSAGMDPRDEVSPINSPITDPSYFQRRAILFAATSLECIHTYSLIHDDLPAMDDDDLRRGRSSCHIEFSEWAAILAGDALNSFAFELLAEAAEAVDEADAINTSNHGEARDGNARAVYEQKFLLPRFLRALGSGAGPGGMVCGQGLDLEFEKSDKSKTSPIKSDERQLRILLDEIHRKKTAALFRTSCLLGAILAQSPMPDKYAAFGETLGLLFQIADDILDEIGDAKKMGKATGKDRNAGKLTYPLLHGLENSQRRCRELAQEAQELAFSLEPGPHMIRDTRPLMAGLCAKLCDRDR